MSTPMVLKVRRTDKLEKATLGVAELWAGPVCVMRCHTVELPWKDNAKGVSCIPEGTYTMRFTMSNRFKVMLWLVMDVPGRAGVRIHAANHAHQLEGCIALGMGRADIDNDGVPDVTQSRRAMELFHQATKGRTEMALEVSAG